MNKSIEKAGCFLSLLLFNCTLSFADSPAGPSNYVRLTANGKYEFRMFVPQERDENADTKKSGLYLAESGDSNPLWTIEGYSFNVIPHSNGSHLVRFGPWASSTSDLAVAFYANGGLLSKYLISDLIEDESKLRHSVSHFSWASSREYDEENNTLMMSTLDGHDYVFSILTGELISAKETVIDDLAELMQLVDRKPSQVEYASTRIKESHYSLRRLLEVNHRVMYYLPSEIKSDRDFALLAVRASGAAYEFLPDRFKADRTIALHALNSSGRSLPLSRLDKSIMLDEEMVFTAVHRDSTNYWNLKEPWNKDEKLLRLALARNGGFWLYRRAHINLQRNRDIVLATIAAEYKNQKNDLLRFIGIRNNPFIESLDRYALEMDDVSRVSIMPTEFLNDEEIVGEFDKLLLVMVELDESKLSAIRKEAYEFIRAREQRQQDIKKILKLMANAANDTDIVADENLRERWRVGLEQQFVEDKLILSGGVDKFFLKSLLSTLQLNGFDYVVEDNGLDSLVYAPVGHAEKLASPEFLTSISRWNQKHLTIEMATNEVQKQVDKNSIVYSTFGPNDDYSTKNSNSGYSAGIGLNRHKNIQERVANGFTVPKEFDDAVLLSIEAAFFTPRNNKGGTTLVLGLYSDRKGTPGEPLETFLIPLQSEYGSQIYTIESKINPVLEEGKKYWLVAAAADLNSELGWLFNGIAEWNSDTGPQLQYDSATNSWKDMSKYGQQAFRIKARK